VQMLLEFEFMQVAQLLISDEQLVQVDPRLLGIDPNGHVRHLTLFPLVILQVKQLGIKDAHGEHWLLLRKFPELHTVHPCELQFLHPV